MIPITNDSRTIKSEKPLGWLEFLTNFPASGKLVENCGGFLKNDQTFRNLIVVGKLMGNLKNNNNKRSYCWEIFGQPLKFCF